MTNKDELKAAAEQYEAAMKDDTLNEQWLDKYGKQVHHSVLDAAQAHLELLELGVTLEDIKALIEARDGFGTILTRAKAIEGVISKWGKAPQDTKGD